MIRIGLLGADGRMGQWVKQIVTRDFTKQATIWVSISRGDPLDALLGTDVVIDFSAPEAMIELARRAMTLSPIQAVPAFVIGSTGWKLDAKREIEQLAEKTPIIMASNFSTGVLALQSILKTAAPILEKLGYTPVITEVHHKHKKDAPSGTAISLQRIIAPAGPGNIQTHSVRAGEIIGDHEITFYGPGDHLTLGHFAQDRSIFARGAVDAAIWLAQQRTSDPQAIRGMISMETYFKERFESPT